MKSCVCAFVLLVGLLVFSAGCAVDDAPPKKVLIGGVLIDAAGRPAKHDTVVVIAGDKIRAAGLRATTPVPAGSEKTDTRGMYVVPALTDLKDAPELVEINTIQQVREQLAAGKSAFRGMISDTEEYDMVFIGELREHEAVFAPQLSRMAATGGKAFELAKKNVNRLKTQGIPMALASAGDMRREMELLLEAGLTPMEVLQSATRNASKALGKLAVWGTIEPGRAADLLLLKANPLESVANLWQVEREMRAGEWVK
jgi:imidazolonepropionase-like amidohydrolase